MCEIEKPSVFFGKPVDRVSVLLQNITEWHEASPPRRPDAPRGLWYRGHGDSGYRLWPGVYRDDFTKIARELGAAWGWRDLERSRQYREREMLSEFRTSGATLVGTDNVVDVYFLAQHHG